MSENGGGGYWYRKLIIRPISAILSHPKTLLSFASDHENGINPVNNNHQLYGPSNSAHQQREPLVDGPISSVMGFF